MAKDGFKEDKRKSPEESGEGRRPERGGGAKREEGGFMEGDYGRGPTPFKMSHTKKPHGYSLEAHAATSGRGGSGIIGKHDSFKSHAEDLEHPQSHDEFERLGTDGGGPIGGRD